MGDLALMLYNSMSLATSSGNETVAAHNSTILDIGIAGDTISNKVDAAQALSGILTRYTIDMDYHVSITTTFTSGGSATMGLVLNTSTSATLASGNTALETFAVTAVASLVQGLLICRGSLRGKKLSRYLGGIHTIATAAMTAGVLYGGLFERGLALEPYRATA